jgi:hypothetical protein
MTRRSGGLNLDRFLFRAGKARTLAGLAHENQRVMDDSTTKALISARRPAGIAVRTRLAQIVGKMDGVMVRYRFWIGTNHHHEVTGCGQLRAQSAEGLLWIRVAGEVSRVSGVEFVFHSFWLTRRGMILLVANLLEERTPQTWVAQETFVHSVSAFDRKLKTEAARWLDRAGARRPLPGT